MINWLIGNGADILMDFESWIYLIDEEIDKVVLDRKNVCVQHMVCLARMVVHLVGMCTAHGLFSEHGGSGKIGLKGRQELLKKTSWSALWHTDQSKGVG